VFKAPARDNSGMMGVQAIVNPANMPKLEKAFAEEIALARKDGFTPEEVAQAKKAWLKRRKLSRAEDQNLLGLLGANEYNGRNMAWMAEMESTFAGLTPEQVNAAFRQHVAPDKFSIFKAGDFAKAAQ
jgi:zinc protease